MQSLRTIDISPKEWRWVFIISGVLAALTLVPYAWALAANASASEWQFMGILANPQDGASYLAKIGQGARGAWLLHFAHTPEPHTGAAIQVFYLLLGHIARLTGVSELLIFHLTRVLSTLFMFSALYVFGATVWMRLRPRRLFFLLVSLGSGLGWLVLLLDPSQSAIPDVTVPEAYPLYAAYANPHFPLTIGALALIAGAYVNIFRIDFREEPTAANDGLTIFLLTLLVAFVFPQALIPFGTALVTFWLVTALRQRAIPVFELRWLSMYILPAALLAAYYYVVVTYNPIMDAIWNGQVNAVSASPLLMILGYGVILLVALPGLWRALRQFEKDADQLMLIWLLANFVLVFLPFNQQRRFMTGLIIPTTFFAVRSIEDYWIDLIPQRGRLVAAALLIVLVLPSNVFALGVPLFGLLNPEAGLEQRLLVERGYWDAMLWMAEHGKPDDVALSSPNIGLWIPAYGAKRVVYGHPWETLDADVKQTEVVSWYEGSDCDHLLDAYHVRYIVVGPQERQISDGQDAACLDMLAEGDFDSVTFDTVIVYEVGS
jgi:hypothetical protein